jgi:serine/threonine protein kinase
MLAHTPQRKYRIERYLAEGGMGAIYVGKKRTFDLVASEDSLFIVMEHVRGADLRTISWRARLKRKALSTAGVIHVALEILAGLAYAHGRRSQNGSPLGIIHRDVSPSNILCSGQGEVKLSDFGIAKATTFSSVFYRVRGKVGYMSPEQAHNRTLDARSDLFSLAVCIFETLTGERLYSGDLQTPPEVIYAQEVPKLSEKRPDLPPELESIMRRALAREPDARYQDARAFSEALRDLARRNGLLYSTPQLAAELAELLGSNPDNWSQDDSYNSETDRLPLGKTLVGKEAASIGVVEDDNTEEQGGPDITVSLRPPRGQTPPPTAPDLPVVAPVERTRTPALLTPLPLPPPPPVAPAPPPRRALLVTAYLAIIGAGAVAGLWWARNRRRPPVGRAGGP